MKEKIERVFKEVKDKKQNREKTIRNKIKKQAFLENMDDYISQKKR